MQVVAFASLGLFAWFVENFVDLGEIFPSSEPVGSRPPPLVGGSAPFQLHQQRQPPYRRTISIPTWLAYSAKVSASAMTAIIALKSYGAAGPMLS